MGQTVAALQIQVTYGTTDYRFVPAVFSVGIWAVHKTLQTRPDPKPYWTVTHVSTGRAVAYELTKPDAIALAQRLFNLAPKLLEGLKFRAEIPVKEVPAKVWKAIKAAKMPATDVLDVLGGT